MKHLLLALTLAALPLPVVAQNGLTTQIVQTHILPRFDHLAQTAGTLAQTATHDCTATSPALRAAYHAAFDAWIIASHLRFGPSEVDDRAFAIAFWPDSRGVTPKALARLIADQDPIAFRPDQYSDVSIAARGLYALEFLLYDERFSSAGDPAYRCALIRTIAADTAAMTAAIFAQWDTETARLMSNPTPTGPYRSDREALQELFKALSTGLQFAAETRLGRPLGTFEKPRPNRAEAWRSARSARNLALSLMTLQGLAADLASDDAPLMGDLDDAFMRAQVQLVNLRDPVFAGVATPQSRLRVEILQQSINAIRTVVLGRLGPKLGVVAGFNALDGD